MKVGAMPSHSSAPMCSHDAAASACGRRQPNGSAASVPAKNANAVTPTMLLRANKAFWPTKKIAETATHTSTSKAWGSTSTRWPLASTTSTVPISATASPIHVRSVSRSRSQSADTAAVAAGTSEIRIEAVPLAIRVSA